jgi:hypothetical protein
MKWTRLTINLDPDAAAAAKAQAKAQRRSFAAYVAVLIEQDLAAKAASGPAVGELAVAEDKAAYVSGQDLAARHEAARAKQKAVPNRGEETARGKAAPAKRA